MAAFQAGILHLASDVKEAHAQLVLLTPPPFDPLPVHNTQPSTGSDFGSSKPLDTYDSVLVDYTQWELSLNKSGIQVIDLHSPMSQYVTLQRAQNPKFSFSGDGIHPSAEGHLFMATLILKGLGIPTDPAH